MHVCMRALPQRLASLGVFGILAHILFYFILFFCSRFRFSPFCILQGIARCDTKLAATPPPCHFLCLVYQVERQTTVRKSTRKCNAIYQVYCTNQPTQTG